MSYPHTTERKIPLLIFMRCHFGPMSLKMVDGATIVKVTQKNIISQLVQVNDKGGVVIGCKYFLRYEIDRKSINTVTGKRKKQQQQQ